MSQNFKPTSQSALLALARTRRMQRALAHAYLFKGSALPTLRSSLGYMTGTACTAEDGATTAHTMMVLGVSMAEGVAYVVEDLGAAVSPILYRLWLGGPRAGHLVPVQAWYEHTVAPAEIRARIAAIEPTLESVAEAAPEAWMLSTRIVQRRALRLGTSPGFPAVGPDVKDGKDTHEELAPLRKYALQLAVEPTNGAGPSGKTTVTAYLRPHAHIVGVAALPTCDAIARIAYTGIPSGVGQTKETVVLLSDGILRR